MSFLDPDPSTIDAEIEALQPKDKAYKVYLGRGCYILVLTSGYKSWRFKYRINRVERNLTLGNFPEFKYREIFEMVSKARKQVRQGKCPATIKAETIRALSNSQWLGVNNVNENQQ